MITAPPDVELDFSRPSIREFIVRATSENPKVRCREMAAFGTRGDGKTWGAGAVMIQHAKIHAKLGFPLPTRWAGVADTFQSHKLKTVRSLTAPPWEGAWQIRDQGHLAVFRDRDVEVHLDLFGIEDQGAVDRLRLECHGLWFEEPAPAAVLVQSSGIDPSAWLLGMTSQRLASYAHPAIMTLNYPDEGHWSWQRFVVQAFPGTGYVRIKPGERASEEDREEWRRALANRPDMLRRLLDGEPGTILLGEQVATGFSYDQHVAKEPLKPTAAEPLWFGQDGGESHTWVTVIGQRVGGRCRIYAALLSEPSGAKQHFQHSVLPWLSAHAPWILAGKSSLRVEYDPACDSEDPGNVDSNPLRTMQAMVPGIFRPGPVSWAGRLNPMLSLFNAQVYGRAVLEIDRSCSGLIQALGGGWYYPTGRDGRVTRDLPKKPNHPHEDYGDAFAYLVAGMAPLATREVPRGPRRANGILRTVYA